MVVGLHLELVELLLREAEARSGRGRGVVVAAVVEVVVIGVVVARVVLARVVEFGRIRIVVVDGEAGFGGGGEAEDGDRRETTVAVGGVDVAEDVAERGEGKAFGLGEERDEGSGIGGGGIGGTDRRPGTRHRGGRGRRRYRKN